MVALLATSRFGVPITRDQARHAIDRFVTGDEAPIKVDHDIKHPEVGLLLSRLSALDSEISRERDRNKILTRAIRETVNVIEPLPPLPIVKFRGADEDPHIMMVDIGDVHVGEKVESALTGGLNSYNFSIFRERGERLRRGIHRLVELHRRIYSVDVLYLNFLGDIVTGEGIYPGQAFQIDMPLLKQVFEGGYWFANLLRDLAQIFPEIHVRAVAGNHGRGGAKGKNHPLTNWDIGVYELMRVVLANHKNINIEISETSWLAYQIPEHERFSHVLIHGDQADTPLGIPWYGFERTGGRLQSMLGLPVHYVHAGHHHNEAEWASGRLEFLINGSWVGGSDLSLNKMMRTSRPSQNLFFCHPRRGVAASYHLHLDNWAELVPDASGIFRVK